NLVFDQIWVLHPDPWPKSRHEKRRLLSAEFLNELAAHLAPGGEIIIGTDHLDYYDWIVEQIKKTNLRISNLESPISTIATRYQRKDMFGAAITKYLVLSSVVK
ncbi:MAG: tRNA (guanine-N7)-methyltransferase, partial [Rickettsiales bacterium]|nr:tRNA (guanine-N7)-methyltransferase [Rickettsiales bacterium]